MLLPLFQDFNLHFEYEERVASFKALGLAKQTGLPSVIVTTSGSAVLECLPALAEAYFSGAKVILITSDRTPEHAGTGFAQTLDQLTPIKTLCRTQCAFHYNNQEIEFERKFPIHINIYTEVSDHSFERAKLSSEKNTLFLFTQGALEVDGDRVYSHIKNNSLHFIEPDSGIERTPLPHEVLYDEQLCKILQNGSNIQIVRVGRAPTSKAWRNINDGVYPHVHPFHLDPDKLLRLTKGVRVSSDEILEMTFLDNSPYDNKQAELHKLLKKYPKSSLSLLKSVAEKIPTDAIIFLGNGMAIRNWKIVSSRTTGIHSNRGINGIDGSIASSIGLAMGTDKKVFSIIGDLTFLYDIGALVESLPPNLEFIVINDNGGRIFEAINPPFPEIICEHGLTLKGLVSGFGNNKNQITELIPCNDQSKQLREEWSKLHE